MKRKFPYILLFSLALAIALATWFQPDSGAQAAIDPDASSAPQMLDDKALPEFVTYNEHIRPIINKNCIACHGGVTKDGGISFLFANELYGVGKSGKQAIVPGNTAASYLLERVVDTVAPMPPKKHGPMISAYEVALFERWIEQGAKWEDPWSYVAVNSPELPQTKQADWIKNDLDAFVLAKMEERGLSPNPEAAPAKLLRRMSFDLIGLPPTVEEMEAFEAAFAQDADAAVAQAAKRLLASPAYGERWASMWMDVARYADSSGYENDENRTSWPYRDYLIRSFNEDKPYDQFIIEQLGGDLFDEVTAESMIAAMFHRMTLDNNEGGTNNEEFRLVNIMDRNVTTWEAFQGVSMNCAQCHDHTYDPITIDEYYHSLAFFNQARDTDDYDFPKFKLPAQASEQEQTQLLNTQLEILDLRRERNLLGLNLAKQTPWTPLLKPNLDGANVGPNATLKEDASSGGQPTLVLDGTVEDRALYEIDFAMEADKTISAIRIELPQASELKGRASDGWKLVNLGFRTILNGASSPDLEFQTPFVDYNRADVSILDINQNQDAWKVYPKAFANHQMIVPLAQPLVLKKGESLQVRLRFGSGQNHNTAYFTHMRFQVSEDPRWLTIAESEELLLVKEKLKSQEDIVKKSEGVSIPVMLERPDYALRPSYYFERGNWTSQTKVVQPGTPGSLPPISPRPGKSISEPLDRLDFAYWIASRENPLTARVMTNRIWHSLFGRGISPFLGDLGTQGEPPSHPLLLDYLAARFMDEHDWQMKPLLFDMVTSATYRQSAKDSAEEYLADNDNRWLSRGSRKRLRAESLRDQALAVSGLLNSEMYGPPVMPFQPEGIWQMPYSKWTNAQGPDKYRRGVYVFWKRTAGYPSFTTFDCPTREQFSAQRLPTNTPLHALVTLNDPVYFETAQFLAKRLQEEGLERIYFAMTAQRPDKQELDIIQGLYQQSLKDYQANPQESAKVATTPELAAWTQVASVLLNLDASLTF